MGSTILNNNDNNINRLLYNIIIIFFNPQYSIPQGIRNYIKGGTPRPHFECELSRCSSKGAAMEQDLIEPLHGHRDVL